MNREVYRHLFETYGKRPGIWFGLITEIIRTLMHRVWVTIIVATIATNLASHDIAAAKQNVILFLVVYICGAIISAVGDLVAVRSENAEYQGLIMSYHHKLTGKDMAFYRDHQTGYLVSLFRQYLDSMMQLVRLLRGDAMRSLVSLVVPAIVLFIAEPKLGLVVSSVVVVQIIYIFWSSKQANQYRQRSHEIYRKVTGEVSDQITNIVAYKSGGVEKRASAKLFTLAKQETGTFWLRRKATVSFDLPREIITALGAALAFWVVLSSSPDSPSSVGLIILTLTYMSQIMRTVSDLPNLITMHDDWVTKLAPTLSYTTNEHETIQDPAKPKKLRITKGTLALKNVAFQYPSHVKQASAISVFDDLNLTIKGGDHIGIVGLSGAGKSTLVSLLIRFDEVTQGAITIDGTDIRDVRQSELHKNIAYVPQEPLLFHTTVRENIAYFNDSAKEADIIKAAKAAHAHDFISKLPQGYDTIVGERGIKLSGGQKQRLVIARAVLKNAPIMIFDEATSALDTESEQIIQKALPKIMSKHTAIVIAHRLSTIASLDRILVMHDGVIIEEGTHDELLKLKGRYYSLWQKQAKATK